MTNTERRIIFCDTIPDIEYEDDVYDILEGFYLNGGKLKDIISGIEVAIVLGVVNEPEAISHLLNNI